MLVKDHMTPNPICGKPDMPVTELQSIMREKRIRHVPILDEGDNLVGLVTQRNLLRALPSDVSGFSRFEISYILGKIKARDVMAREVITIDEEMAIEDAARTMADKKIGCLPVCRAGSLVGIITDNDLFSLMVDLLGAHRPGIRITIMQPDRAGEMARLTTAIAQHGGFLSVVVGHPAQQPGTWISVCKVTNLDQPRLRKIIQDLDDIELIDLRETTH